MFYWTSNWIKIIKYCDSSSGINEVKKVSDSNDYSSDKVEKTELIHDKDAENSIIQVKHEIEKCKNCLICFHTIHHKLCILLSIQIYFCYTIIFNFYSSQLRKVVRSVNYNLTKQD